MFKNLEIYKNNDVKAHIVGGPGGGNTLKILGGVVTTPISPLLLIKHLPSLEIGDVIGRLLFIKILKVMKNFITSKILLYYKFFRCGITHILKCLINHESARLHLSVDNIVYCLCNHVVFQNQLHLELKKMSKLGSNVLMVKVKNTNIWCC